MSSFKKNTSSAVEVPAAVSSTGAVDGIGVTIGLAGMVIGSGEEVMFWLVYFATEDFRDSLYPAVVHFGAFTGASSSPTAGWLPSTLFLVLRAFSCPEQPST